MIPVIPIHEVEAWMLAAEHKLLREVLMTDMEAQELGLVNKVKQVESLSKPKEMLMKLYKKLEEIVLEGVIK